jgi:hypothetical protein
LLQFKSCQRPIPALDGIEKLGVPYLDYDHEVTETGHVTRSSLRRPLLRH